MMTALLVPVILAGVLIALVSIRLHPWARAVLAAALIAAYLVSVFTLDPASAGSRLVSAATVGFGAVALAHLVRVEIPARRHRRRQINAAEAAIREGQHERIP